eukprot:2268929-Pyramimonas_sp.AAC.2
MLVCASGHARPRVQGSGCTPSASFDIYVLRVWTNAVADLLGTKWLGHPPITNIGCSSTG